MGQDDVTVDSDYLRLRLVGVRAELRTARQDLVRRERSLRRTFTLTSRTIKEREVELDLLIHADADVTRLEDVIRDLQYQEDLTNARLENALRPRREYEWFVRERMADSQNELAASFTSSPFLQLGHAIASSVQMSHAIATSTGEDGPYVGDSDYIHERELR